MKKHSLEALFLGLSQTFVTVARALGSGQDFRQVVTHVAQQALRQLADSLEKAQRPALTAPAVNNCLARLRKGPGEGSAYRLPAGLRPSFSDN